MSKIKMEARWGKWMVEEGKQDRPVRMDGQSLGREQHLVEARPGTGVA